MMCRDQSHRGRRDIGAERIEAAMGDIENRENAEYQRQSQRNNEQPGSLNQPVDNDRQKEVHGAVFMPIIADDAYNSKCRSNVQQPQSHVARRERSSGVSFELTPPQPSFGPGRRSIALVQLHLAPCMPPLIQSSAFTPGGGLTHSAGKYWMSTRSTRFASGLYLVREKAIDWIA